MTSELQLSLTDELQEFVSANCGDGTPYATPGEYVLDLLRQRMLEVEAAQARAAILEGYRDAIQGRTVEFAGNLRKLLE